ncbi:MAG TPA: asparagine synthase (glutamine-hydrolyzing) [Candidatus Acidoferrum sp.]|nr:asparagine synthase (glutamine-hydrolyzing) [Candidatus Acidoferrum sp.]
MGVVTSSDVDARQIDGMRDRLAHRGPDGARTWISRHDSGAVAFGHRRLAIIDLSEAANQPMFSADKTLAIIYNGEIYNYVELREELRARDHVFRTESDTEVLLAAYSEWGADCLPRLNGMFAFALWDASQRRLLLARDRFGEKPLFYARLPHGGIAFASEAKALFAHPDISASVNDEALRFYLDGRYFESDEVTLFKGIKRLPGAHAMTVDGSGEITRLWRYWTLDFSAVQDDYHEREAVEKFRHLMRRSVSMRLRSDVPVGTSLSGGLDSSTVVALVAQMKDARGLVTQNTFSARFDDDPALSEGPYVDLVAAATGVKAHMVTPHPERLIAESRSLHYHQEEPFLSASIYLQWCVARLAAAKATTVILDGQGADELLGGYQYYFPSHQLDLVESGQWWPAVRESALFSRRLKQASRQFPDSGRRFNRRAGLSLARLAMSAARRRRPQPGGGRYRSLRASALISDSLPQLLRYADRNAMAFSRETRLPFLDYDLVDFVAGLPERAFVGDGWQKLILRRAGEGLVPSQVLWRSDKMGYAAPLDRWLRDGMKTWAHERLFTGPITNLEAYDRAALQEMWNQHQSGSAERSWALWRWISLNEWLSMFDDGTWSRGQDSTPSSGSVAETASRLSS